jgi:hypothetical protein
MPKAVQAAMTVAPVCPALNSAPLSCRATRSTATRIDARGFRRSAEAASIMPTTSGASTISSPSCGQSACDASACSSSAAGPTSAIRTARWRAAATAPSMMAEGAWSPPIASTAIRIMGLVIGDW